MSVCLALKATCQNLAQQCISHLAQSGLSKIFNFAEGTKGISFESLDVAKLLKANGQLNPNDN